MNRRSILFAAFGLTLAAGAALAAGHVYGEHDNHDDRRFSRHGGYHHDDDEPENSDRGGECGPAAAGPNAPSTAAPDNSLFLNGARPTVSVQ